MIWPKREEPQWKSTLEPDSGGPQEGGVDLGARKM